MATDHRLHSPAKNGVGRYFFFLIFVWRLLPHCYGPTIHSVCCFVSSPTWQLLRKWRAIRRRVLKIRQKRRQQVGARCCCFGVCPPMRSFLCVMFQAVRTTSRSLTVIVRSAASAKSALLLVLSRSLSVFSLPATVLSVSLCLCLS